MARVRFGGLGLSFGAPTRARRQDCVSPTRDALPVQRFHPTPGGRLDRIRVDDRRFGRIQNLAGDAALYESDGLEIRRNPPWIERPLERDALLPERIEIELLPVMKLPRDVIENVFAVRIAAVHHSVFVEYCAHGALLRHRNHLAGDFLHLDRNGGHGSRSVERDLRIDFNRRFNCNPSLDTRTVARIDIASAGDSQEPVEENSGRPQASVVGPPLLGRRILQTLSDVILDMLENAGTEFGFELRKRRPGAGAVGSGGIAELLEKDEPRGPGASREKPGHREEKGQRRGDSKLHPFNLRCVRHGGQICGLRCL